MEGSWREKTEKKIVWPHWSATAVENFVEWIYTEDYKGPYPTPIRDTEELPAKNSENSGETDARTIKDAVPVASSPALSDGFDLTSQEKPRKRPVSFLSATSQEQIAEAKKRHVLPFTRVQGLVGPTGNRKVKKLSKAEEYDMWTGHMLWRSDELDYENTLMTHAELHVMACQYMLDDLKELTWQRLRSVLISVGTPVHQSLFIRNLVKVLRYVYKETATDSLEADQEPLLKLLSTFTAQHFTQIKGPEIDELFGSATELDREIVVDVTAKITQIMDHLEARMAHLEAEVLKEKENEKKRDISEVESAYYPLGGKGRCNKCKGTGKFPYP